MSILTLICIAESKPISLFSGVFRLLSAVFHKATCLMMSGLIYLRYVESKMRTW